eukprot:193084-Rhodomonas_salina.2
MRGMRVPCALIMSVAAAVVDKVSWYARARPDTRVGVEMSTHAPQGRRAYAVRYAHWHRDTRMRIGTFAHSCRQLTWVDDERAS